MYHFHCVESFNPFHWAIYLFYSFSGYFNSLWHIKDTHAKTEFARTHKSCDPFQVVRSRISSSHFLALFFSLRGRRTKEKAGVLVAYKALIYKNLGDSFRRRLKEGSFSCVDSRYQHSLVKRKISSRISLPRDRIVTSVRRFLTVTLY